MQIRQSKKWLFIRVLLTSILLAVAFNRPASSKSSLDEPYDSHIYLPLLSKPYPPLPAIQNGDFELGNNGDWTEYSSTDIYYLIGEAIPPVTPPARSGDWIAWLGGLPSEVARLSQDVTLPADGPAYLRYYYQVYSEKSACNADQMRFLVGATELVALGLCDGANTQDWTAEAVDLSAYAGQTITIMFEVTTNSDGEHLSNFYIDDVSLARNP
jgi:hypothetical protein